MTRFTKLLSAMMMSLAMVVSLVGCEQKGPAQVQGEKIDKAVKDTQNSLDPKGASERVGEKLDNAGKSIGDTLNPKGPAEKAGEKIDNAMPK